MTALQGICTYSLWLSYGAVKCFGDTSLRHTVKPDRASNDVNSSPGGQVEGPQHADRGYSSGFLAAKSEFDRAPRLFLSW